MLAVSTVASAQGPGASGAAATIPERDVRPSLTGSPNAPAATTATVGQSRERNMTVPREGMGDRRMGVGTSNPENSTSR
jgi:hypothetical protein